MSNLILQMREGDTLMINGATVSFHTKATIDLRTQARFLFGKQIMSPEAADTQVRQLYLALQTAYIGSDEERAQGLMDARVLTTALKGVTPSKTRDILTRALAAVEGGDCYTALKFARQLVRAEDVALRRPSLPEGWRSEPASRNGGKG